MMFSTLQFLINLCWVHNLNVFTCIYVLTVTSIFGLNPSSKTAIAAREPDPVIITNWLRYCTSITIFSYNMYNEVNVKWHVTHIIYTTDGKKRLRANELSNNLSTHMIQLEHREVGKNWYNTTWCILMCTLRYNVLTVYVLNAIPETYRGH